jgi:metallo-beta-lactamase family protein
MELTIWGAAEQVTGSMHLLTFENYKVLVDCGLDYERDTYQEENQNFPFDPSTLDLVILTHAHIDHTGNLPTLVRLGFQGQVLCTPATADLTELLLMDAVNIFLSKQKKSGRGRGRRQHSSGPPPLYLQKHVNDTMERFITIGFHKKFQFHEHASLTFIPIGHLLGAAAVILEINDGGTIKKIGFSGDVGRKNYPVLVDPEVLPQLDYLVLESTYGGKFHTKDESLEEKLVQTIQDACIKYPGRLIIPAFSIGRTQALVFTLNKIFSKGLLPRVQIFVDSPMANFATDIYRKHHDLVNDDAKEFYHTKGDEFDFEALSYVTDKKESVTISNYHEPCIIISSAGMLEGGRIQDHLFHNIQNYYCTILFIGYCAPGTLGNRLLRGDPIVRLRGRDLMVYASIKQTDLLSGHGDHQDLVDTVITQNPGKLKNIFLVHGERKNMEQLQDALAELQYNATIAIKGTTYKI